MGSFTSRKQNKHRKGGKDASKEPFGQAKSLCRAPAHGKGRRRTAKLGEHGKAFCARQSPPAHGKDLTHGKANRGKKTLSSPLAFSPSHTHPHAPTLPAATPTATLLCCPVLLPAAVPSPPAGCAPPLPRPPPAARRIGLLPPARLPVASPMPWPLRPSSVARGRRRPCLLPLRHHLGRPCLLPLRHHLGRAASACYGVPCLPRPCIHIRLVIG
jgi:hypothetical protein